MSSRDDWERFRSFADLGSAEVLCSWLQHEDVPGIVEPRVLETRSRASSFLFIASSCSRTLVRGATARRATRLEVSATGEPTSE